MIVLRWFRMFGAQQQAFLAANFELFIVWPRQRLKKLAAVIGVNQKSGAQKLMLRSVH